MKKQYLLRFNGKYKKEDEGRVNLDKLSFDVLENYTKKYDSKNTAKIGFFKYMKIDIDSEDVYYNGLFTYKADQFNDIVYDNLCEVINSEFDVIEFNKQEI